MAGIQKPVDQFKGDGMFGGEPVNHAAGMLTERPHDHRIGFSPVLFHDVTRHGIGAVGNILLFLQIGVTGRNEP